MTPRQADQKWVEDTRADYLSRAKARPWEAERSGLLAFALSFADVRKELRRVGVEE